MLCLVCSTICLSFLATEFNLDTLYTNMQNFYSEIDVVSPCYFKILY